MLRIWPYLLLDEEGHGANFDSAGNRRFKTTSVGAAGSFRLLRTISSTKTRTSQLKSVEGPA